MTSAIAVMRIGDILSSACGFCIDGYGQFDGLGL